MGNPRTIERLRSVGRADRATLVALLTGEIIAFFRDGRTPLDVALEVIEELETEVLEQLGEHSASWVEDPTRGRFNGDGDREDLVG